MSARASMKHSDLVSIHDLRVDCIVGVYPSERNRAQPLAVDVDLVLDTEPAARSERLSATVDYAATSAQIAFILRFGHFKLLETAAHALARYLLAKPAIGEKRAAVTEARIRLRKPDAAGMCGVPALEIRRDAAWVDLTTETKPFGTVDIVHETEDAGIYRLNVAPGQSIPLHVHRRMHEAELVLGEGLLCQGKLVRPGTIFRWPHDAPHRYDNPTDRPATILCIDAPRFIESDEIVVEGAPADVIAEIAWGEGMTMQGRTS